jgi:hypothetical protein
MAHPDVVHCKRARYDVYIGRPSKWGNPFQIVRDGARAEVIARYERWVGDQPELIAQLGELEHKTLGCWYAPNACHGDVLIDEAEFKAAAKHAHDQFNRALARVFDQRDIDRRAHPPAPNSERDR